MRVVDVERHFEIERSTIAKRDKFESCTASVGLCVYSVSTVVQSNRIGGGGGGREEGRKILILTLARFAHNLDRAMVSDLKLQSRGQANQSIHL